MTTLNTPHPATHHTGQRAATGVAVTGPRQIPTNAGADAASAPLTRGRWNAIELTGAAGHRVPPRGQLSVNAALTPAENVTSVADASLPRSRLMGVASLDPCGVSSSTVGKPSRLHSLAPVLRISTVVDAVPPLCATGVAVAANCDEVQASTPPSRHKRSRMPVSQRGAPRRAPSL